MSRVFTATWDGVCGNCELPIQRGEQARYDVHGELIHAHCDVPLNENGRPKTCPACNLLLPRSGICGNC